MNESRSWTDLNESTRAQNGAVHFLSMDTAAEIAEFSKSKGDLPIQGAPSELIRMLRLTSVPYYLVVTPDGTIRWAHRGALSKSDTAVLRTQVAKAALK